MSLQFRRGTAADVTSENFAPAVGEPLYITDEDKFYIGDGSTIGGNLVGGAEDLKDLTDVRLKSQEVNTLQSYSVSGNTVTINTATATTYAINDQVTITDASVSILNGTHTLVSKPSGSQFLFELTTANVSNTLITGTVTGVIENNSLLSYNSTNSRFEDKRLSESLGTLSNHSDVQDYDRTNTPGFNNDIGKILRYDVTNNWNLKRPGEALKITSGQHFLGVDFSYGQTGNIYTGNTADWTEDFTTSDLHSANPGNIPYPPYGDAVYDSTGHDYDPVGSYEDSTDFTLDFWLYRDGSGGTYEHAMLFYSNAASAYPYFYPKYSGGSLALMSGADGNGNIVTFAQAVVTWSVPDLDDQWVHVSIVRKGTDFRAWVNGADQGAGTLGTNFANNHNFKFSQCGSFYSMQFEQDGHLIGPHYLDLKRAHRDPAGGDIAVPAERVDFNNLKSGIKLEELLDTTASEFINGDVLTYHGGIWTKNKSLYGRLYYSQATAPTGTVQYSDRIGNWTGLTGQWRDMTFANTTDNDGQGPYSAAGDPTLLLEDQQGGINMLSGLPAGVVRIDLEADFVLNNLAANSYNAHWLEILWQDGSTDVDTRTHFVFPAHTATSTPITITQRASVIAHSRSYDSGYIECNIDQEQNADYYISRAILSVTKIG